MGSFFGFDSLVAIGEAEADANQREKERGWDREREKLKLADMKRRASAPMSEFRFPPPRPPRGRRVVSASPMLGMALGGAVTEEPEEVLQGLGSKAGLPEEDEEEEEDREEVDDPDLPPWARRESMSPLARTHALLVAHLPPPLLKVLPSFSDDGKDEFLSALTSGQLLCAAYNVAVRRSRKPWGFISADAVHDVLALEAESANATSSKRDSGTSQNEKFATEGKKGWTFRRIDNLRLWAA